MHLFSQIQQSKELNDKEKVVAAYHIGLNGNAAGKKTAEGKIIFDCHTYGRAIDLGGLSTAMPDSKAGTSSAVRLGTDFVVLLHWGRVPMWDGVSVAADPGNPSAWTRLTDRFDDKHNYSKPSNPASQLHYRLDPAPFQDPVPALNPPDADLTAALGKVAPHFTRAAALFKTAFDVIVREYQDADDQTGPQKTADPPPSAIDTAAGRLFTLHPDYPRPNTINKVPDPITGELTAKPSRDGRQA